ncbi:MAG: hypothetical protein AAB281_05450, partial [Actinomycetota bacterium]
MTMFVKCFDFVPYFRNETDGVKKSEDYKPYRFSGQEQAAIAAAILNTSTFLFYFVSLGDCFHCGKQFILQFPLDLNVMQDTFGEPIRAIGQRLMADLKVNAIRRRIIS